MFLKQEQVKPTHLTQLTSYCLLSSSMCQNISWEKEVTSEKHYSTLHVSRAVITLFRTSHHQSVYCAPFLQSAQLHCLLKINFYFFILLMCRFQALLSIKVFLSNFFINFLRLRRPIGDKNC